MSWQHRVLFICGIILFFAPSFWNYFVCDDFEFLGRIDWSTAGWYFTHSWGHGNEYRPLLPYSYAADRTFGGVAPQLYHFTNTFWHAMNALLVSAIFARLAPLRVWPLLTAAIFAINPVSHESVLWVSGRPVVISSCCVLLTVWAAMRASTAEHPTRWWMVSYLAFVTGLLVYEGSIVAPLLVLLALFWRGDLGRISLLWHISALFVIAGAYVLTWNALFHFRITRFPVEHSVRNAIGSISTAFFHSFHGSFRLRIAILYAVLLGVLSTSREGRRLFILMILWFGIAYLPFFMVHGYADRFAYLAAAPVAFTLSAALREVYARMRLAGLVCVCLVIVILSVGMIGRIRVWRIAGEIAERIPIGIQRLHPALTFETPIILVNVPQTYRDAYVFLTGVERAVQLQYRNPSLQIFEQDYPALPETTLVIDCSNGIVRDVGPVSVLRRR
jgi:hypothetical protein